MLYRFIADIAVLVHFLWIVFLFFGAFAGVRYRAVKVVHIIGLGYALVLHAFGWYCPLTHVEAWARRQHDPELVYAGSFIIHYLEELIYFTLPDSFLLLFTIILCAFNAWYYFRKGKGKGKGRIAP
ncbi:MAG: DUF2784 domain-containing protein [Deltaproteobacteria bacterium]|nr:DUF2784 domain-containing protein [Deltaproteobacteria bacterium]